MVGSLAFPAWADDQPIQTWKELFDPPYTKPTELPADSPIRKKLFDLLRVKIQPIAKQPVRFEGRLRVFKNWAMFVGDSLGQKGKPAKMEPFGNSDTAGLWLRTQDGWKLVEYSGGHSDLFWGDWHEKYGVPRALLKLEDAKEN